jgi:hypothetical protein
VHFPYFSLKLNLGAFAFGFPSQFSAIKTSLTRLLVLVFLGLPRGRLMWCLSPPLLCSARLWLVYVE